MRKKIVSAFLAACLVTGLTVGTIPTAGLTVQAATDITQSVENGLVIEESDINQLLTGDLVLPAKVDGLADAVITYSVGDANADYVSIEDNTLKVTRPLAGEGNYRFTLTATVEADGDTYEKAFPLTIREGLSDDSYAGYVYVSFAVNPDNMQDVQQLHFFLSEDGMNWTALNGCNPVFLAGNDYAASIEAVGKNNYEYLEGTDISQTVKGDASVLFPFEGNDQGVRDPYLLRGAKADGSDADKVWLLATDLNTHDSKYGGVKATDTLGNWGETTAYGKGSTALFVWETEDWVNWERRFIDVGASTNGCMAWAPEAIYNPEKDNYLVYWSARTIDDNRARDRLYCCETEDFVTFGPTKLYEQDPFYKNHGSGVGVNSGYGNIDTSMLWVPETDEEGKIIYNEDGTVKNQYGTLYRLVKDETNNHIELQKSTTVLDPNVDYDSSVAHKITPYTLDGVTYSTKEGLAELTANDKNQIKTADVVWNWFKNNSVGDHFKKVSQTGIEKYKGAYEGATMFKFIDRDEWCVMIDFYGDMAVRYEPYLTTNLGTENSITKVSSGYGREGGDIGTHGGMIPVTVAEYNAMVDTYNADPSVDNYHPIEKIAVDNRALTIVDEALSGAVASGKYTGETLDRLNKLVEQSAALTAKGDSVTSKEIDRLVTRTEYLLKDKVDLVIPQIGAQTVQTVEVKQEAKEATTILLDEDDVTLCVKATGDIESTAAITAYVDPEDGTSSAVTWSSSNAAVASVDAAGNVKALKAGSAVITATTADGVSATCNVTVLGTPKKITLNKKKVTLKKGKDFQIEVKLPKGTACEEFTYKSNKKKVAVVSSEGEITAKKKGTAKITVTAKNNKKAKATITVKVK